MKILIEEDDQRMDLAQVFQELEQASLESQSMRYGLKEKLRQGLAELLVDNLPPQSILLLARKGITIILNAPAEAVEYQEGLKLNKNLSLFSKLLEMGSWVSIHVTKFAEAEHPNKPIPITFDATLNKLETYWKTENLIYKKRGLKPKTPFNPTRYSSWAEVKAMREQNRNQPVAANLGTDRSVGKEGAETSKPKNFD